MEIQPRELREKDLWRLLKIVDKASADVRATLQQSVGSAVDAQGNTQVFVNQEALMAALLNTMVEQEAAIKGFLADLIGIQPEKFDELPFGAALDVLSAVLDQEAVPDFLAKLYGLVNKDWSRLASAFKRDTAGQTAPSSGSHLTALPPSSTPSKPRRSKSSTAS